MSAHPWLDSSPHMDVLNSLRTIAWADGALSPDERAMITGLVRRLGLAPPDEALRAWLDERPDPWSGVPSVEGSFERHDVLGEALRVAYEDGDYSPEEQRRILTWAAAWGITTAEVAELEAEYLQERATRDPFRQ